jgi:hypothetical protein
MNESKDVFSGSVAPVTGDGTATAPHPDVTPIVAALAERFVTHGLLRKTCWLDIEDLIAEAQLAVLRQRAAYDRKRGASFTTWAYRVAWSAMIDLVRGATRIKRGGGKRHVRLHHDDDDHDLAPDVRLEPESLAEWAGNTLALFASRLAAYAPLAAAPRSSRRGRPATLTDPQIFVLLALMRRQGCSANRLHAMLAAAPDLRRALRLTRCPGRASLIENLRAVQKFDF